MTRFPIFLMVLVLLGGACGSGGEPIGSPLSAEEPGSTRTTHQEDGAATATPPPAGASATATPTVSQFVELYLVKDGRLAVPVVTAVPASPDPVAGAIEALIEGPNPAQQEEGLSSSIPTDTILRGLRIEDGLARIDLSDEFEAGGGTFTMTSRLAQIVYTLTSFGTVDAVELSLEGEVTEVFSSEGLVLDGPVDRSDFLAALPLAPSVPSTVEIWGEEDLPDVGLNAEVRRVVLVADDDVLNVRIEAGADRALIGALEPGSVLGITGLTVRVGSSTWYEVVSPVGAGWVNGHYLGAVVEGSRFFDDRRVMTLLDELSAVMADRGDLRTVASDRGLYISHHSDPVRFTPEQLATVLTDPEEFRWPSNALDNDDPDEVAEIRPRTFAEAIGDSFVSTWEDPHREHGIDLPLTGGNGRVRSAALPFELSDFHFVSAFDPGDEPEHGGLDWTSWHVSIDYEDGQPVVVGLTLDQWGP